MNENINLCEILKDCPKGTKLYSSIFGFVKFKGINTNESYPINVVAKTNNQKAELGVGFTEDGKFMHNYNSECTLFPSKDQRDWSKFKAPWLKKPKFDPKTLQPFDKVLVHDVDNLWQCCLFSHITNKFPYPISCTSSRYEYCIPYNEETKHLVGTNEEAPEHYRYWE